MSKKRIKLNCGSEVTDVAVCARAQSRHLMYALMKEMKAQHNVRIHLYCFTPQELRYYQELDANGIFASITNGGVLKTRCFDSGLIEDEVLKRARGLEDLIGHTINRLMVADRHFGRGYCFGGYYHPRSSFSEDTTYIQVVHAYSEALLFWDAEFKKHNIKLCLNGTREAAIIARARSIPYRVLISSRHKNYHFWAHNELYESPEFEQQWLQLKETAGRDLDEPYHAHSVSRNRYKASFGGRRMMTEVVLTTARTFYWRLRGYAKGRGYFLRETIRYHFLRWSEYRKYRKLAKTKLSDLAGKQFVYYPLHVEPETALHGLSPEYFYQQALIAAVARDLPAGVRLAVKEAYGAIGRRPSHFYRQISDLKNVVLLDVWESGLQCAKNANVVVTICGTAGLEAAVNGTPVIAFGQHNSYNFLPSVKVVHDERELRGYLQQALSDPEVPKNIAKEGRRLLQAIIDCSFDLGSYDYVNLNSFDQKSVSEALNALIKSMGQDFFKTPSGEIVAGN